MKTNEVKINGYYTAKVSDKLTVIRIVDENPDGGWDATNTKTGKRIRIKSPTRLRQEVTPHGEPIVAPVATGGEPADEPSTDATEETGRDTGQPGATVVTTVDLNPGKKLSLVDAAIQVMTDAGEPLGTKRILELVTERGLWEPARGGKTPDRTLYSAITREISAKGDDSRFEKSERGKFALK